MLKEIEDQEADAKFFRAQNRLVFSLAELNKNKTNSLSQQKAKDDEDDDKDETLSEKEAREAEVQKAAADRVDSNWNKFTGNYDDPSGKHYFVNEFG